MHIEVRDILPWAAGALSLGTILNRFKNYGTRITNLERRHTTKNGESLLMSYKAHDKICEPQKATFVEIKDHLEKKLNHFLDIKWTLERKMSDQVQGYWQHHDMMAPTDKVTFYC